MCISNNTNNEQQHTVPIQQMVMIFFYIILKEIGPVSGCQSPKHLSQSKHHNQNSACKPQTVVLCFCHKLKQSKGAEDWLILNKSSKISNGTRSEMKQVSAAINQMLAFCGINCPLAGTYVPNTCVYACLVCDQHQKTLPIPVIWQKVKLLRISCFM